ncbi:MAG: alpha-glucan phosphorylase [Nitrospirae bacterium GWC2_57_13]|jgi:glycogen phosphorylase|nr:MAG: alpha-glucan phosphorylase [Nitrospirae bacterium GWC2_57_13]OGW45635.1 MAG: alpha-glucan phosphorylase [Nitrospirae bacterium GWD2_57_8]
MNSLHQFTAEPMIAYFSMETGIRNDIPTYSGGLGVLAGDTIKSAADLKLPFVAVTLISRKGYFTQEIDTSGWQTEKPVAWDPAKFMALLPEKVKVRIEERDVTIQAWIYLVESPTGGKVPVLYLDTDVPENQLQDRGITDYLYGGDQAYRIKQEVVLGMGGVRMLSALGFHIKKYHMNEGHASFLVLDLLLRFKRDIESVWDERSVWDIARVRDLCVFTTHTPVEAGHDKFPYPLVQQVLGEIIPFDVLKDLAGKDHLNMTMLALNLSKYINGVAKKHGEVSQMMFPGYQIHAITNGVHTFTWTCEDMAKIFDKYIPGWANEPELFVRSGNIPELELWEAHREAKKKLLAYVRTATGHEMDPNVLTFGFARRATAYKRMHLLFHDVDRIARITEKGKLQIIFAGKAHPHDENGKRLIQGLYGFRDRLPGKIDIAFLPGYNMDIALKLVSGVDVWLNTPLRPLEASGTSGMKAAHNGVVNFSVLDGWWIEGHIEGFTGWSIGAAATSNVTSANADNEDAADLYDKLENIILPKYYNPDKSAWARMMKSAISKNAYYFNSHRMMRRYVTEAYIR